MNLFFQIATIFITVIFSTVKITINFLLDILPFGYFFYRIFKAMSITAIICSIIGLPTYLYFLLKQIYKLKKSKS